MNQKQIKALERIAKELHQYAMFNWNSRMDVLAERIEIILKQVNTK